MERDSETNESVRGSSRTLHKPKSSLDTKHHHLGEALCGFPAEKRTQAPSTFSYNRVTEFSW